MVRLFLVLGGLLVLAFVACVCLGVWLNYRAHPQVQERGL